MNEPSPYVYVITCYTIDSLNRIELKVCAVFKREEDAEQYMKQNIGAQPDEFGYVLHETDWKA